MEIVYMCVYVCLLLIPAYLRQRHSLTNWNDEPPAKFRIATKGPKNDQQCPERDQTIGVQGPDLTFPDLTCLDLTFPDLTCPNLTCLDLTCPELTCPDLNCP